jgi:hypothetical protein
MIVDDPDANHAVAPNVQNAHTRFAPGIKLEQTDRPGFDAYRT